MERFAYPTLGALSLHILQEAMVVSSGSREIDMQLQEFVLKDLPKRLKSMATLVKRLEAGEVLPPITEKPKSHKLSLLKGDRVVLGAAGTRLTGPSISPRAKFRTFAKKK